MSLLQVTSTTEWIRSRLLDLKTQPDTAAYVVGVLSARDLTEVLHVGSIVLAFHGARDFEAHRRLADGVLASEIAFQGWLAEPSLCVQLAQRSYNACFRLLNGAWACYGELSDRLPEIIVASREAWLSCRTRTPDAP